MTESMLRLGPGEFVMLDSSVCEAVHVQTGTIWLTQERDPDDHFIAAGASLALARCGSVCIQARDDTTIRLMPRRASRRREEPAIGPTDRLGWAR